MKDSDGHTHALILSLIDILAPLPFEIVPNHYLSKVPPELIELFKNQLNTVRPYPTNKNFFLYEYSQVQELPGKQKGSINYQFEQLPLEKWKYWSVSHKGTYIDIQYLQQASLLLKNEIEFGFSITYAPNFLAHSLISPAVISYLSEEQEVHSFRRTAQITIDDLKSVAENYSLIKGLKPEFGHIKKALELFDDLRAMPRNSDFVLIGLFSIIESIISHSPKYDYDSIKHQIRTKIPLLKKRFMREFNYSEFFDNEVREDKILSTLYDYRSAIVHAGNWKMPANWARILKGKEEVKGFLKELTKQLLTVALKEPDLVTDLKLC